MDLIRAFWSSVSFSESSASGVSGSALSPGEACEDCAPAVAPGFEPEAPCCEAALSVKLTKKVTPEIAMRTCHFFIFSSILFPGRPVPFARKAQSWAIREDCGNWPAHQ